MSDKMREIVDVPVAFMHEGTHFLQRCTKPNRKEFIQICRAVGTGFVVMGFIGYLVKLIHIPINNILVYVMRRNMCTNQQRWRISAAIGTMPHTVGVVHGEKTALLGTYAAAATAAAILPRQVQTSAGIFNILIGDIPF